MKNEIVVHTDKGEYVGGDIIFGAVYLCIHHPITAKNVHLEIKGYEKVEWVEEHTEWKEENGQRKAHTVYHTRKGARDFFKDAFALISYPGGFPVGSFSYPFQYRLPDNLPGVFEKKKKSGHEPYKAKIVYKVKAVVDVVGSKDLKCKQHLYIHEKLDKNIQPKHHLKTITVRTLCCIPRGPVTADAWLDKNAYMAGEVSHIHVKVENNSEVAVNHFNMKLVRSIQFRDNHGHVKNLRDIICMTKYDGTFPHSQKTSDCPLPLMSKKGRYIRPSTSSKLIHCEYFIMIELDIPWAPDLEIYSPIVIYAAQNPMWAAWQPPQWIQSAQTQQVCTELAVPLEVAQAQMTSFTHAPPQIAPPQMNYTQNNSNNVPPPYNPESTETSSLLKAQH